MPQPGISKGLSFSNDWNKDIDRLYQREEYAAGVRARKQQDAEWFADKLKKGHGSTPYVEGRLNEFYKEKTKIIADWAIANPGFRTDIGLMEKWNDMTGELLNNDILREDLQVKQNFEKLQTAVASKQITKAHYEREMEKYKAYAQADPSEQATPYVFENPLEIDPMKLIADAQAILRPVRSFETKGNKEITTEGIDPIKALNLANDQYSDEDSKVVIDKLYSNALETDPNIKTLFPTVQKYWASKIIAGDELRVIGENFNAEYLAGLRSGSKDKPVGLYFMRNEYDKIKNLEDGQSVPGTSYALALTAFGGRESINTSPNDGILVKSNNSDGYMPLDASIQMEAINFRSYKNIAGKLYGEVDVNASSAIIKNGAKVPETETLGGKYKSLADSTFADWNFVARDATGSDIMSQLAAASSGAGAGGGTEYTGTILIPINLEATTLADYDGQFGTAADTKESSAYYSDPTNLNAIQQREYDRRKEFVTSKIKENSVAGVSYSKEITDPKIIKEIGRGYVYVTVEGKDTDEKGNKYVMDMNGTVSPLIL